MRIALQHWFAKYALSILAMSVVTISGHAQWGMGAYLGPGLQTVVTNEPTIADPYRPRLLPQFGTVASYRFNSGMMARGGLGYDLSGTKYQLFPQSGQTFKDYWVKGRLDYLKAFVGLGYGRALSNRIDLQGFADFAAGIPVFVKFKHVEDGKSKVVGSNSPASYGPYLGMNLGLSLKYNLSNNLWCQLSPTFQTQFNSFLGQGSPVFRFAGFVPRLELGYTLPSKYKKLPGYRGNKKLYIEDI